MSVVHALIRYSLLWALPLLGLHTLWISSVQNGFFAGLEEAMMQRVLPGSPDATRRTCFTGIYVFDSALELIVVFYWPVGNGNSLPLSLLAIPLATTLGVAYVLIVLEASRWQPLPQVIRRSALIGTLVMLVGPAITLPIYFALNLAPDSRNRRVTSRDISRVTPRVTPRVPTHTFIQCLPACLIGGYYLIVFILCLPSPAVVSYHLRQGMIVVLQGWPLWVSALFWITSHTMDGPCLSTGMHAARSTVYMFAICTAAIPYLAVVMIGHLPRPYCVICVGDLSVARIFLPNAPWSPETDLSLEEGLQRFFQWDFGLGSIAILLWAIGLAHGTSQARSNSLWIVGKGVVLSALLSPCGAAVVLLWQRDRHMTRVKGN